MPEVRSTTSAAAALATMTGALWLADGVNYALDGYSWEIYEGGVALVLVVVALNLLGEGLQASLRPAASDY